MINEIDVADGQPEKAVWHSMARTWPCTFGLVITGRSSAARATASSTRGASYRSQKLVSSLMKQQSAAW